MIRIGVASSFFLDGSRPRMSFRILSTVPCFLVGFVS